MSFIPFLMGAADTGAASSQSQTGSLAQMVITFGLIFLVMYFLIFRPQKKKEQETKRMIDALKKGDKVVTIGGIHGVVSATKEKTIVLKVDDNTKIEFNRTAIASVVGDKPADAKKDDKKKDKDSKGESAAVAENTDFIADAQADQPSESK